MHCLPSLAVLVSRMAVHPQAMERMQKTLIRETMATKLVWSRLSAIVSSVWWALAHILLGFLLCTAVLLCRRAGLSFKAHRHIPEALRKKAYMHVCSMQCAAHASMMPTCGQPAILCMFTAASSQP